MSAPKLVLDDVHKSFGSKKVLRGIDLEVEEHEIVCLIGPSGCGKSTILRCIDLLDSIDGGEIRLGDERISGRGVNANDVRRRIGIVFQSFNLFSHMNVLDNVTLGVRRALGMGRTEAEERGVELLERFGLGDKLREFPERLSGGQQQRAAIVRALMGDPELLLLDEVTSALDPELVGEVLAVIRELADRGLTMVLATHEMGFARDAASRVAFLDEGRVLEYGPPAKILSDPDEPRTRLFLQRVIGRGSPVTLASEIQSVSDPSELAALFGRRPEVHIYGLGDLDEPFWSPSRWVRRGDAVVGVVPLPDSGLTAVYAVSDADPEGTLDLLAELVPALPVGALITGPTGLARRCRAIREIDDLQPHVKMVLRDRSKLPEAVGVTPLDHTHAAEIAALHATDEGAAFWSPAMLGDDTAVGLRIDGDLVAAAGTHVVSDRHSVAAIGGVITHPDHRGKGYGGLVTAGTIARLGARVTTIGLNVVTDNEPARRAYARIGFEVCWSYEEIELR